MGCACKVSRHISKVEEKYGTNIIPSKKTEISSLIKMVLKKGVIITIIIPFIPLAFMYVLIRNRFTKKAISIDKLFNL